MGRSDVQLCVEGGSTTVMSRLLEKVDQMEMLDDAFNVNLLLLDYLHA